MFLFFLIKEKLYSKLLVQYFLIVLIPMWLPLLKQ